MKKEQLCEIKKLIKQFKELWDKSFKTKVYDSLNLEASSFFTQEEIDYIYYAKVVASTRK